MRCRYLIIAGFSLMTSLAFGAGEHVVDFAGSSTIQPLMDGMAPLFAKGGLKARVQGGGSGIGVKSTLNGMAKIGMVSRDLTSEERIKLRATVVARDAIAVIVNARRPESAMSCELLRAIYLGEKRAWDDGKTITVINKESGRATLEVFEENLRIKGKIRRDAVIIGPNGQAVAAVDSDPNAIGYVSLGDALEAVKNGMSIKVISLDGVEPTPGNVRNGSYKLSRALNLIWLDESAELASKVLSFVRSPDGRKMIEEHHFLPVE